LAHGRLLSVFAALATASTLVAACDGGDVTVPRTLMDDSPAAESPVDLEGIESPTVSTSVTVTRAAEVNAGSTAAYCLQQGWDDRPFGPIVVRVGVSGESVTFRNRSRRGLYGCDNSEGPREENRRWCGSAFGQLDGGHLRDPRLDMGSCTTRDGGLLGFAWIEPSRGARYVVVQEPTYAEVYEVAGGSPVRVTTTRDVEIEGSRAAFDISEHESDGELIRRYRLEARVAG
jgi:hypothetical protein